MKRHSVLVLVAGCLLGGRLARAQDALRSALSLEPVFSRSQTAPVDLRPDRPHLGPVQLTLGGYAGLELNDDVNSSQSDPQSDLLLRGGLNLGFLWPATEQSELRFASSIGYVHYLRHSQYDHLEVSPNSALSWTVGLGDGRLTLFDQFSYSQQVLAESALVGLATFPRLDNTAGFRVNWLPGHWALDVGYSHDDSLSDSSQFRYLNGSSEYFFGRGGWRFAEATQAGIEASSSLTRYELATQIANSSVSVGPYADWQVTQALHASLRGGPVFYFFDSAPVASQGKTFGAYYLGFEVTDRLTDFLSWNLSVQRDVRQGLNAGSSYIEELIENVSASWSLTQRLSVGAGFTAEQGTQPFDVPITIPPFGTIIVRSLEHYDRFGGSLNAAWHATDNLTASLVYYHWLRDSNLPGNSYGVNSLSLSVTYAF